MCNSSTQLKTFNGDVLPKARPASCLRNTHLRRQMPRCSDTGTWYSSKVCTLHQCMCQVHWVKGVGQVFLYWDALSTQLKISLAVGWSHLLKETFCVYPGTHVAQLSCIRIYFILLFVIFNCYNSKIFSKVFVALIIHYM